MSSLNLHSLIQSHYPLSNPNKPCQNVCPHLSYRPPLGTGRVLKVLPRAFSWLKNPSSSSLSSQERWFVLHIRATFMFEESLYNMKGNKNTIAKSSHKSSVCSLMMSSKKSLCNESCPQRKVTPKNVKIQYSEKQNITKYSLISCLLILPPFSQ